MISFIICSIYPDKARALTANIQDSVGVGAEVIIVDNRHSKRGICEAYNNGANKAHYQNLCFVHEDVLFQGENWGEEIEEKLAEPNTGIIGFMGATYKSKAPSGWNFCKALNRSHFIQTKNHKKRYSSEITDRFSPCVVLDGACLFMRKEVWQQYPFDEKACPGFHCYDLDICIQMYCAGYANYVCGTCWIEHFSEGSFNKDWAMTTLRLHATKWKKMLPLGEGTINSAYEARAFYIFLKNIHHLAWSHKEKIMLFNMIPYKWRHCITAIKSAIILMKIVCMIMVMYDNAY